MGWGLPTSGLHKGELSVQSETRYDFSFKDEQETLLSGIFTLKQPRSQETPSLTTSRTRLGVPCDFSMETAQHPKAGYSLHSDPTDHLPRTLQFSNPKLLWAVAELVSLVDYDRLAQSPALNKPLVIISKAQGKSNKWRWGWGKKRNYNMCLSLSDLLPLGSSIIKTDSSAFFL